jgi:hypothetical protein
MQAHVLSSFIRSNLHAVVRRLFRGYENFCSRWVNEFVGEGFPLSNNCADKSFVFADAVIRVFLSGRRTAGILLCEQGWLRQ